MAFVLRFPVIICRGRGLSGKVLDEDFDSDQNQDDAAGDFRGLFIARADEVADVQAGAGDDGGDRADEQHGKVDVHRADHGEGYADGQRVDAGGNGHHEHRPERERIVLRFFLAEGLANHVRADQRQKDEGDPVIVGLNQAFQAGDKVQ